MCFCSCRNEHNLHTFCLLCSTVLLHNAIPFVGFGFLDNCIMIVAVSTSASCSSAGIKIYFMLGIPFPQGEPVHTEYITVESFLWMNTRGEEKNRYAAVFISV